MLIDDTYAIRHSAYAMPLFAMLDTAADAISRRYAFAIAAARCRHDTIRDMIMLIANNSTRDFRLRWRVTRCRAMLI